MQVENERYYHIHRVLPWSDMPPLSVGESYRIGDDYNPFYSRLYSGSYTIKYSLDGIPRDFQAVNFLGKINSGAIIPDSPPAIYTAMGLPSITLYSPAKSFGNQFDGRSSLISPPTSDVFGCVVLNRNSLLGCSV